MKIKLIIYAKAAINYVYVRVTCTSIMALTYKF